MKTARRAPIPRRALIISVFALAIPIAAVFAFPGRASSGIGTLVWLSALIPAFLLAYYRGLRGVAVALSGGMAVITATQLSVVIFQIADPDWSLLLGIVGVYLAVSVGIAVLAELMQRDRRQAEDMALVDRLTNLPNRRHLDLTLQSAFASAERGHPLAVVIFDLDRFKRVNDTHGHAAGDLALRAFGEVLGTNTRKSNLSARFGGEEFVSVLSDGDVDAAVMFAERVLAQMRSKSFEWGTQTVSAGIAVHEQGMGSFEVLLGAADRALYEAKADGRDRVRVAERFGGTAATDAAGSVAVIPEPLRTPLVESPHRGLVYIVDDIAELRSTLRLALTGGGYDVWDSGDPREAVSHFAESSASDRPDVILTDVIMPNMTGMTMIDQISKIEPALRVVYMSGFVNGPVSWTGLPGLVVEFLNKPISMRTLLATVEEVRTREPSLRSAQQPLATPV